jgi:transposase-like protein
MGRQSGLDGAQRREAVLAMLRREEPVAALARRYGVAEQTLYRWRDEFLAAGEAALAGTAGKDEAQRLKELEQQLAERDQVIGELTIVNRLLKKRVNHSS